MSSEGGQSKDKVRSGRSSATGYVEQYAFYAERFGASERTVKRWVAIGKKNDEVCPLDEPERMRAWWSANMSQKCPDGILRAEIAGMKSAPEPENPKPVIELITTEEGMAGALARLEQLEVQLAREADQPGKTDPWLRAIARMTPLAEKLRKELQARGELAPKREVEGIMREYLEPVEKGIRGLYSAFCRVFEKAESPVMEAEWNRKCDEVFSKFNEELFHV